jgi:hypothetical protein
MLRHLLKQRSPDRRVGERGFGRCMPARRVSTCSDCLKRVTDREINRRDRASVHAANAQYQSFGQVGSEAHSVAPTLNQRTQPLQRRIPSACFANKRSEQTLRDSAIAVAASAKFAPHPGLLPDQPLPGCILTGVVVNTELEF